ncbi:MAG TPA: condensation domain-containing protein, partial [Blastocatellia bacterium]
EIDRERLSDAFREVVASSDSMRTVIQEREGIPFSSTVAAASSDISFTDLSGQADPDEALRNWVDHRIGEPMDMNVALFDSALLKVGDGYYAWFLRQHQIISDPWSLGLTFKMAAAAYGGAARAGKTVQAAFSDYFTGERSLIGSEGHLKAEAYWKSTLANISGPVCFYGQSPDAGSVRTARESIYLEPETVHQMVSTARLSGMPTLSGVALLSHLFLGFMASFVSRLTGARDICIGVAIPNRRQKQSKQTLGNLTVVVPIRVHLKEENETFEFLWEQIRTRLSEAIGRRRFPLSPRFQRQAYDVVFRYVPRLDAQFDGMPADIELLDTGRGIETLAVQVTEEDSPGAFKVNFDFLSDVFDCERREHAIRTFRGVIDEFLAGSDNVLMGMAVPSMSDFAHEEISFDFLR